MHLTEISQDALTPTQRTPSVIVDAVSKSYGNHLAVDQVCFSVMPGEIFGVLGKNGAGKTSLFEMIEGLRAPSSGTLTVCGIDVARSPRGARQKIGAMLQNSAFFAGLVLHELVDFYAALKGGKVDALAELERFGLSDKSRSLVRTLSGGQKQRFAFLIATLGSPDVLMLDEPSAGLDVGARRDMWELIRRYRDAGRTVVLSTHYMEEAEALCDRVAILNRGRLVALGAPDAIIGLVAPGLEADDDGNGVDHVEATPASLESVFISFTQEP